MQPAFPFVDVSTPVDLLSTMITPQNPAVLVRDFKTRQDVHHHAVGLDPSAVAGDVSRSLAPPSLRRAGWRCGDVHRGEILRRKIAPASRRVSQIAAVARPCGLHRVCRRAICQIARVEERAEVAVQGRKVGRRTRVRRAGSAAWLLADERGSAAIERFQSIDVLRARGRGLSNRDDLLVVFKRSAHRGRDPALERDLPIEIGLRDAHARVGDDREELMNRPPICDQPNVVFPRRRERTLGCLRRLAGGR